jgi:hypothetical protein
MRRGVIVSLLALVLAAIGVQAAAARAPLKIGSVVPELLDPGLQGSTIALMKNANLAATGRVTVTWQRGQTAMDIGLLSDLRNGIDKARAAGIDIYLDAYPDGQRNTPSSNVDQTTFAVWLANVINGIPGLRHVIVGNEPNLNLFWFPQFGPSGQDVAATGYERLLARTYDLVKAATPGVEIVGGTLAHSGTDKRGTGRDTHSPVQFILDIGKAYRASHRQKPIMGAFSYHPYMERSDLPPTFRHVRSKTVTIADYGKLVSALNRAFVGTQQKGSTLPIVYDEFGVESTIPPAQASQYTGREPPSTHPVSQSTQANYYAQGFHLAACQPNVRTLMVFRLIDSPFLASWQSGVYYADRKTPKSSLRRVATSATLYGAKKVAGCAALLAPKPFIDWKKRRMTCDMDCAYIATFRKNGTKKATAVRRGKAIAGVTTKLPTPKLPRGVYRMALRVTATAYKANAFTWTSPPFRR